MKLNVCTAGFARLDITPPLGTYIGGYFSARYTKGVLDPIYVRALAFGQGDKSAVVLVVDQCGFRKDAADVWPDLIAERLELPREAVFVCCTHSHTTPEVGTPRADAQYDAWLLRRLGDAAQMALDDRKTVIDVRGAQQDTQMTFSRRYRMKDGAEMGNPPAKTWEDIDKIAGPLGKVDQTIRLIRVLRQDGPELLIVSFQSHPDCIGGEYISADFPGAVCDRLEEVAENACGIFLNGAQGNMVINDRMKPLPACGIKDYQAAMDYGIQLADKAMELYDSAASTNMEGLFFGRVIVCAKTKRGKLPIDYCEDIVKRYMAGGLAAIDPNPKIATPIVAEAQMVWNLEQLKQDVIDLPVSVVVFCGVALAGIPGEPFSEIGRSIRENSPFPVTCTCCLTNGSYGYFANLTAIEEGGYDTVNTKLVPGTAEQLADAAIRLLNDI